MNAVSSAASLMTIAESLTRAGIMAAAPRLTEANNPFVLPGIAIKTSSTDAFPTQQVALRRWSGGH